MKNYEYFGLTALMALIAGTATFYRGICDHFWPLILMGMILWGLGAFLTYAYLKGE